jgi:hypothetical protein
MFVEHKMDFIRKFLGCLNEAFGLAVMLIVLVSAPIQGYDHNLTSKEVIYMCFGIIMYAGLIYNNREG